MIIKKEISNIDEIEFELIKDGKFKKSNKNNNYVNNKELLEELILYYNYKNKMLDFGLPIPPLSDKIGIAIMQIATRRCNSRMYVGYTNNWKEEMIGNAITTATLLGHNFDPNKSSNPFAYFTQICDNAIKEQLKKEKRQTYIRYKSMDMANGFSAEEDKNGNDAGETEEFVDVGYEGRLKYIKTYEDKHLSKKTKDEDEDIDQGIFR